MKVRADGRRLATFGVTGLSLKSLYEWEDMEVGYTEVVERRYQGRIDRILFDEQRAVIGVRKV